MKSHRWMIVTLLAIAMAAMPTLAAEIGQGLEVKAVKVTTAPTIDGELNDAAWVEAARAGSVIAGFINHTATKLAGVPTIAYVAWDEDNVYFASANYRSSAEDIVIVSSTDGTLDFGNEDGNELYFDVEHTQLSHVQLAWNAAGVRWASNDDTSSWTVAVSQDDNAWYSEVAIPWSTLGVTPEEGALYGFNFNGFAVASGDWIAWAPTYGAFAQPQRFGHLILEGPVTQ